MSRTYASVNEAWQELRNRTSSDKGESSADAGRRHGYDPNQPRVPKGHPDGGQWTDQGESENDPRILSDVESNNDWASGARYASRRRRSGSVIINGQVVPVEPGQAARLAVAEARAHDALSRVRELDASWRPKPSAYATVEGLIRAYQADAQAAEARIAALASAGIGPGPFAVESIPARGPGRDFNAWERQTVNRFFRIHGCHTCGTFNAGTTYGNCVLDHQLPTALNHFGRPQRLYPQCVACSRNQGLWIINNR